MTTLVRVLCDPPRPLRSKRTAPESTLVEQCVAEYVGRRTFTPPASSMTSETDLPNGIRDLFRDEVRDALIALRRDLHRHPELAFKEERTASALERALHAAGATDV